MTNHGYPMTKIAVFGSGSGTNFEAIMKWIHNGNLQAEVALVVCDKHNAGIIAKAEREGLETLVFSPKDFESKAAYEKVLVEKMQSLNVEWVILAGFMRLVGEELLHAYPNRIINIHPSLLPAYKGKDAIGQAYRAGEKEIGVSIHYVDEGMDTGTIIAQKSIKLTGDESLDEVEMMIHAIEHRLYPATLENLFNSTKSIKGLV
mgnify:CR=1 FL=1